MMKDILKKLNLSESGLSLLLGALVVIIVGVMAFNFFRQSNLPTPPVSEETVSEEEQELTTDMSEKVSLPTKHTLQKGEYLCRLAEKYYGDCNLWVLIAKENNLVDADLVEVGTELVIPKANNGTLPNTGISTDSERGEIFNDQTEPVEYTVVKNDNLWNIAVKRCGDGYAWPKIANANQLTNPDIIHNGNKLLVICQ